MRMLTLSVVLLLATGFAQAQDSATDSVTKPEPNRPKVRGTLVLNERSRREEPKGSGQVKVDVQAVEWQAAESRDLTRVVEGSDGP